MALLTLAEAKDHLDIPSADTTYDTELQGFVDAVIAVVEGLIGGPAENRTVTEVVEPTDAGRALILTARSVSAVTSITANGVTVGLTDLYLAPGRVLRRQSGLPWYPSRAPVLVSFTAGLGATAPAAAKLAAKIIVAHMWATQRGSAGNVPGPNSEFGSINTVTPGYGYAIPNRALELLAPYMSKSGLG